MYAVLTFIVLNFTLLILEACTYSVTLVHTQGIASDVVDETATNSPSTSVTAPISGI